MSVLREKILNSKLTDFEKSVLLVAIRIPKGQTRTYSQIAKEIGKPRAVRAVGNALNKNPFSPQVPCHRVVGKNWIGGYAQGIKKKKELLRKEKIKLA